MKTAEEIVNNCPSVKIGIDDFYGKQTFIKAIEQAQKEAENSALHKTDVNGSRFQSAYAEYWDKVKDIIDEEGWVYTKEAPHMLDAHFEGITGKPIEFQKSFGKSGDNPHWLTRGSRWRPSELS